jgi:glycosyltransferase involved in cell wall biosynthesis
MTWSLSTKGDRSFYVFMVLRVALDLAHTRQSSAGTARVARSLHRALAARDDVVVLPLGDGRPFERGDPRRRALALYQDLAWYPEVGRRAARRAGADVYHLALARGPLRRGLPPVSVTVHDLVPQLLPETMSGWNRRYSRATFVRMVAAADLVVTSSETMAAQLSARRIAVVPLGVADELRGPAPAERPAGTGYVLFVGTPEPRKNLARLAEAVAAAGLRLVVAGAGGWGDGRPGAGVEWLGRVDDRTLHALYAGAACLAIPSLDEGFGLPAVEAMAVGCPVVAARAGALPEVCGDAAVLVDPLDTAAIAAGLTDAIARRTALVARGREHAARYTWERSAELLVSAWRSLR